MELIVSVKKSEFFAGLRSGLPVVLGYLPISIAFGIISVQSGISLFYTLLMSVMVFAGASQFMAANMLLIGSGGLEIVLATFILNLRHFIMSMSLSNILNEAPKKWMAILSYGITDETFAIISFQKNQKEIIMGNCGYLE